MTFRLLVLFFFLGNIPLFGQTKSPSPFSVDLHLFRYATTAGMTPAYNYHRSFSYLNGFGFSFQKNNQLNYLLSLRKIKEEPKHFFGTAVELTTITGGELALGLEYLFGPHKRFYLGSAVLAFLELTHHKGIYDDDAQQGEHKVNLFEKYYGTSGRLSLHFRLTDTIELWGASRFQWGRIHFSAVNEEDEALGFTNYRGKWRWQIDPLHTFALRFRIRS